MARCWERPTACWWSGLRPRTPRLRRRSNRTRPDRGRFVTLSACCCSEVAPPLIQGRRVQRLQRMRKASVKRTTKETDVEVAVDLDGAGMSAVATGIGFLDHMLDLLARHSRIDIT